jgi:peptidoglycan hydrolase-like protein with peptidoglycan-binding domain
MKNMKIDKIILEQSNPCGDGFERIDNDEAIALMKQKSNLIKKVNNIWCKQTSVQKPVTPKDGDNKSNNDGSFKKKSDGASKKKSDGSSQAKPDATADSGGSVVPKPLEIYWTHLDICNKGKFLQKGLSGLSVESLQTELRKKGFSNIPITGVYDEATFRAVAKYQTEKGMPINGLVDRAVWNSIFEDTPYACEKKIPKDPDAEYVRTIKGESLKKIKLLEQDENPNVGELKSEPITKTVSPEEQSLKTLKKAINLGCIDKLKLKGFDIETRYDQPTKLQGTSTHMITGQFNGQSARILSNGTIVDTKNNILANWECEELKAPEPSKTCVDTSTFLNPRQENYIRVYLEKHAGWTCETPSDYEISKGLWEVADLGKQLPHLFDVKKGPFFLYRRVGSVSTTNNNLEKVNQILKDEGWTRNQPEFGSQVDKSTIYKIVNNGNEIPGVKDAPIFRERILNPTDELNTNAQDLAKNMRFNPQPKKDYCKQGVILLYNASQNSGYKYFNNATDIVTVRDYVYRCLINRIIKPNKNSLGVGAKLYDLTRKNYGPKGASRFYLGNYGAQTYTENVLSKTIKKKLLEMLEKKKLIS